MAIGSFNRGFNSPGAQAPMAEINTTPLVDVMLVLLIIFIITAPLMTHSVQVDLPRASSAPTVEKATVLQVIIDAENRVKIGVEEFSEARLELHLREAVARDRRVELHLQADRATRYESVAMVLATARRAGVVQIGFLSQPRTE